MRDRSLELTDNIARDIDSIFEGIDKDLLNYKNGAERVSVTLFKQLYGLFKAILLLCKNDLALEAKILVRSFIETSAYFLFISDQNHEERVEWYRHSISLSEKIAVEEFNASIPLAEDQVDSKFFNDNEKEAIEYFRKKHNPSKSPKEIRSDYTLKPKDAAYQLTDDVLKTFKTIFSSFYRPTAALSHGQAPLQQVAMVDGQITLKSPTKNDECVCLKTTCVLLYYAVSNLNTFFKMNKNLTLLSIEKNVGDLLQLN